MTGLFGAAPEPMSLWAMLGGGLLAFVSPCVLPMLPVYAMYLLGGTDAAPGRLRVLPALPGAAVRICAAVHPDGRRRRARWGRC